MIEKILSPVCYEIWKTLDHPEDWRHGHHHDDNGNPLTIVHKETHVCLWIGNGSWFLDGYNTTIYPRHEDGSLDMRGEEFKSKVPHIGLLDRHILWRKARWVVFYLEDFGKYPAGQLLNDLRSFNERKLLETIEYFRNCSNPVLWLKNRD